MPGFRPTSTARQTGFAVTFLVLLATLALASLATSATLWNLP